MPAKVPNRQVHREIREQIQRMISPDARFWQGSREPVNQQGRGLSNLCHLARRNVVKGKSFFGHGSWYAYLEKHHRVMPLDHPRRHGWWRGKPKTQYGLSKMDAEQLLDYTDALAREHKFKPGSTLSGYSRKILQTAAEQIKEGGKPDYRALLEKHGGSLKKVRTTVRNLRLGGVFDGPKPPPFDRRNALFPVEHLLGMHDEGRMTEIALIAVVLSDLYDLKHSEIGRALGLSRGYVDKLMKPARETAGNELIAARFNGTKKMALAAGPR